MRNWAIESQMLETTVIVQHAFRSIDYKRFIRCWLGNKWGAMSVMPIGIFHIETKKGY